MYSHNNREYSNNNIELITIKSVYSHNNIELIIIESGVRRQKETLIDVAIDISFKT